MTYKKTLLIFLHGFLGSNSDWQKVIDQILQNNPQFDCLGIDLPGHGRNKNILVKNFAEMRIFLQNQIPKNRPLILIGYSLGGRVLMDFVLNIPLPELKAVFIESGNFGLKTEKEKFLRLKNDENWAKRFEKENLKLVLNDWYQQNVFGHLDESDREILIEQRIDNDPKNLGIILRNLSLANQDDFLSEHYYKAWKNLQRKSKIFFIFGEKDSKFKFLIEESGLPFIAIEKAGHNAHLENPRSFAKAILNALEN